jgi:hypothetical protein
MQADYKAFVDRTIGRYEGGYGWDRADPAGPTKYRITCYDLAAHRGEKMTSMATWAPVVQAMPFAEAEDIYRSQYAVACRFDDLGAGKGCVLAGALLAAPADGGRPRGASIAAPDPARAVSRGEIGFSFCEDLIEVGLVARGTTNRRHVSAQRPQRLRQAPAPRPDHGLKLGFEPSLRRQHVQQIGVGLSNIGEGILVILAAPSVNLMLLDKVPQHRPPRRQVCLYPAVREHLIPEMEKNGPAEPSRDVSQLGRTQQVEGIGKVDGITNGGGINPAHSAQVRQHPGEQARPGVAPARRSAHFQGAFEAPGHHRMARREQHDGVADQVAVLAREKVRPIGDLVAQADDVGVDPPPPLLRQQHVAEDVGEGSRGALAESVRVDEQFVSVRDLRRVADADVRGDREVRIKGIEIDAMAEIGEGFQA